jgi:type IV pilus assembly protein PilW
MSARLSGNASAQCGAGMVEVMVSVVIGMLMVLVIFQVYQFSEGQKRTITSGGDAGQNASYAMFLLGRDVAIAGSGIASSALALDGCRVLSPFTAAQLPGGLRPIPVLVRAGATDNDPDEITVFYGGSGTLSTPVQFRNNAATTAPYQVAAAVGFSENDVIVAVSGAQCTMSTINAGGVAVSNSCVPLPCKEAVATITHTPVPGSPVVTYTSVVSSLVNLGPKVAPGTGLPTLARVIYSVDPLCPTDLRRCTLRTTNLLPLAGPPAPAANPIVADVVSLKALYGLDTTVPPDGIVDTWVPATGAWSFASLTASPGPALATLQMIRAVRIAIVTRGPQHDPDVVTPGPLSMFAGADAVAAGVSAADAVSMTLTGDQTHYRYRVFETVIPLRNAMWNSQ